MTLPSNRSFFTALLQYTHNRSLQKGKALHAQIIKSSSSCVYIANSLVNLYAKCQRLREAKFVFERIQNKDVVSWNCIINGYSQHGPSGSSHVMELFQRMRAENTAPNAHTLLAFHRRLHLGGRSRWQTSSREEFGFLGDDDSGYASQKLAAEALGLFRLMRREEEGENEFVFTSVLSALTLPELVNNGKQIHCIAVKNGLLSIVSVGNALVTMYAKCGSLDDALQTFETSSDKNSITWSAMITGYAQSGDSDKALKLFSSMHLSGIRPSEFTFVGVINACSDLGAAWEGKQVHDYLLKLGFESQIYVMTALVDMYAKCSSIVDARKGFDYLQEPDMFCGLP
ncbi:Pentatricopeptide repeat-containing protein [Vitis vinifera]|uniref:Pentatricopeptide repeat-containing protein n=1 Tax=Vitis vinifera TaxID=29760 RepID=A0A438K3P9_VITVI|nr:Pentatricopeptide repeat-containing protein [Vitis vinifera]